jgi:hypothetical protein
MRAVERICWLLVCLAMMLPLAAAPWVGHRVAGLTLYVRPGHERQVRMLMPMVEQESRRVAGALGLPRVRSFPIFAFSSRSDFLNETGRQPNLLGESFSPGGEIYLDASGAPEMTRSVLAHELTHSLLDQRLGHYPASLPRWVNEGIAGHLSDPVSPAQLAGVSQMIHRDGVLTLDELDAAFPDGPYRDAAYLQGRSMIAWLEYEHPGALLRLLDELATGQTFDEALRRAAGLTAEAWIAAWHKAIPAYMYWLTILTSPVVYAPMALLLAVIAVRRILRKRAEQDETDDEPEAYLDVEGNMELPPLLEDE